MTEETVGTPRVNAEEFYAEKDTSDKWEQSSCNVYVVDADFARQLEREVAALTTERDALDGIKATLQHYAGPDCGDPSNDQLLSWMLHTVNHLGGAMRSFKAAYEDRDKRLIDAEAELDAAKALLITINKQGMSGGMVIAIANFLTAKEIK